MIKNRILFGFKPDWHDAIIKSTLESGYEVSFADFNTNPDYFSYELVIPLSINDQVILNKICLNKNTKTNLLFTTEAALSLCNDKHLFNQFLINNNYDGFVPCYKQIGQFPYILKKRISGFGYGCYIINNTDDELKYFDFINDTENYFTQEIIIGEKEYTTHIVYKECIVFNLTYEFTYHNNIFIKGKGTEGKKAQVIDTPFLDLWSEILKQINFCGIGCFNYKIVNGMPKIFEFNPRFGASLARHAASLIEAVL